MLYSYKWPFLLFIFFSIPNLTFSNSPKMNEFHKMYYLGEQNFDTYFGQGGPLGKFNPLEGSFEFVDDLYYQNYFNSLIQPQANQILKTWFQEIPSKSKCPDYYLNKNIIYIRYLYRLLTISYVFEGFKSSAETSYSLGINSPSCAVLPHQIFKKCQPQSNDMKKFLVRMKSKLKNIHFNKIRLTQKNQSLWFKKLSSPSIHTTSDLAIQKILRSCQKEGHNCQDMKREKVKKILEKSCFQDLSLLKNICSEKDSLYGLSYIKEARLILEQSNVLNVINAGGFGKQCLKRFSKIFSLKEEKVKYLKVDFPLVLKKIQEDKQAYLQGELFLPGALKEFDEKGLMWDLFTPPPPPPKKASKPIAKIVVPPASPSRPAPIILPKKAPLPILTPTPLPAPKVDPIPLPSYFMMAVKKQRRNRSSFIKVDMEGFKTDFLFTDKMLKKLDAPLKTYQTREALIDMRTYDYLGTKKEPVRLIFLKYMIDQKMHKGLYNLIAILGDSFWTLNDFDGDGRPIYIELKNDASTEHLWQITILPESLEKEIF